MYIYICICYPLKSRPFLAMHRSQGTCAPAVKRGKSKPESPVAREEMNVEGSEMQQNAGILR